MNNNVNVSMKIAAHVRLADVFVFVKDLICFFKLVGKDAKNNINLQKRAAIAVFLLVMVNLSIS